MWLMVLLRILSFVMLFGVLSFNEGQAFHNENEAKTPQSTSKKRTRAVVKENEPPSPFSMYSPETAEKAFLSPIRNAIILADTVNTDFIRKLHPREKLETFYEYVRFNGKTVYKRDKLFDPFARVLNKEEKWESNYDRMKRGLCPVGHSGIVSENEAKLLTPKEIRRKQKRYQIELHHITQKDTGTDDDPIRETTKAAHGGSNARYVIVEHPDTNTREILGSRLEKEEALLLIEKHKEIEPYMDTNVLHPRKGASLIERDHFAAWRIQWWKARSAGFEAEVSKKSSLKKSKVRKSFSIRLQEANEN